MLIRVINPNTTESMTATIDACARAASGLGTRIEAITSSMGPVSIESHYDEALAVPGLLRAVQDGERDGASGYVVACFGDPGLDAAREVATGPVLGIAEAAMHAASFLGRSFSVVTTLQRTVGRAQDLAAHYGFAARCRGVYACDIPVLDLETDPLALATISDACQRALDADGSDVIVLGCAGMADLCDTISNKIGAPVVDGVAAATVFVEGLVRMRLRTAGRGEWATPPAKPYVGGLAGFAPAGRPAGQERG